MRLLGVDLHILTKYARNSGSISFNRNYIIQINSICTTKMRCGGVFYRNTKYCKVVGARTGELWGFTTASDRQRLEGFLRRGCRQNLYSTDKPSITQTVEEADENLFNSIRYNTSHLLHQLLPRRTQSSYSLRSRPHNFELSHIHDDRNFIDRMLFTARCTLVQSAVLRSHVVCLSVRLWRWWIVIT